MTALERHVADYLRIRRALGFKLERAERLLVQYLAYLDACGQDRVTVENALAWARLPTSGSGSWWAFRISAVRGFATYLHALDDRHEVPPAEVLARRIRRSVPYLYTEQEIWALMAATDQLRGQLRRATYRTLFGLLAVTGMRVGEAIQLDRAHLELAAGRRGDRPRQQVRQVTRAAAAPHDRHRPARVPADPRRAPARGHQRRIADLTGRNPIDLLQRARDLPPAPRRRRPDRAFAGVPSTRSRSPPPVRCADASGLVSRRRRRATQAAAVEYVYGPHTSQAHVLVFASGAGVDGDRRAAARGSAGAPHMSALAPTVQAFFIQRLLQERNASPHTIAAYRDTIRLLLRFAAKRCEREPSMLDIADLDADTVAAFLDHLQTERGNSARTRNARLAAIHSLYRYAAAAPSRARPRHPTRALDPTKTHRPRARHVPRPAGDRCAARRARSHDLDRPPRSRPDDARDPDRAARVRAHRARRRRRSTRRRRPRHLRRQRTQTEDHAAHPDDNSAVLRVWLAERAGQPGDPLFPTIRGRRLSRDALERRLALHVAHAADRAALAQAEERHAAHAQAHRRDAAAARRDRLPPSSRCG